MKVRQIKYAKIIHDFRSDTNNFSISKKKYNVPSTKDKLIVKEIVEIIKKNKQKILTTGGEWDYVNAKKRGNYINALNNIDYNTLLELFTNMFQNSTTYGIVTPSYEDIKNKKIYISQILNDLDSCIEFSDLQNLKAIWVNKNIGNAYGLLFKNKVLMPDSPRHFYFSKQIMKILDDSNNKKIIEIGGGYGGMAKILCSLNNNIDYYSVDLFEGCLLQYYYLSKCNIKAQIVFNVKNLKKNTINLIPFSKKNLDIIKNIKKTDLVFNSRSFSELDNTIVNYYFKLINKDISPRFIYHENSNYLLFPKSKRHIEILAKNFKIDKKIKMELFV